MTEIKISGVENRNLLLRGKSDGSIHRESAASQNAAGKSGVEAMLTIKLAITKLVLTTTIHIGPAIQPDYAVSAPAPVSQLDATISTEEILARLDAAVAQ
jgi:hypothetical protein